MGRDDSATLAGLKAHRRELIDRKITEYGGRIVKATGDGLLLEFPRVVDAVRCAVDVQRGMAERNAGLSRDSGIVFGERAEMQRVLHVGREIRGGQRDLCRLLSQGSTRPDLCVRSRMAGNF